MQYDRVKKNATQQLSLTGFTVSEFEFLLPTYQVSMGGVSRPFYARRQGQATNFI